MNKVKALRDSVKMLAYNLSGVIADVEQGAGFDSVCLDTVKQVELQLFVLADKIRMLRASEREGWRYSDELEQERTRLQSELDKLNGL